MGNFCSWNGAAPINFFVKSKGWLKKSWQLRWTPVCGSTELELSRWLKSHPLKRNNVRAFIAGRQSHGKGQRGRVWHSPNGGVWLSSAVHYDPSIKSAALLGLAVAVALAHRLESSCIPVKIKWPNDLLVQDRKIAGFLSRVIYRGQEPILISLGIGLNVFNNVPIEGVSISGVLGNKKISLVEWTSEVLLSIENALLLMNTPESLCREAERLLWTRKIKKPESKEIWDIEGIDINGQLKVSRNGKKENWTRSA